MGFTLEFPTEDHVGQISAIWEAGWHEAHAEIVPSSLCELRTTRSFADRARESLALTRIALKGPNVLGFCILKESELYQMYVSSRARGSGVAQALIEDAEIRIGASGHALAWLACAIGNERAGRFYEKSGWTNMGQEVVDLDTSEGAFPLEVWRFEKRLSTSNVG
jgi:GNAT superfamily N-acetyltransferase